MIEDFATTESGNSSYRQSLDESCNADSRGTDKICEPWAEHVHANEHNDTNCIASCMHQAVMLLQLCRRDAIGRINAEMHRSTCNDDKLGMSARTHTQSPFSQ